MLNGVIWCLDTICMVSYGVEWCRMVSNGVELESLLLLSKYLVLQSMTEPDFRGGADRNPQLSGVDLDHKPTLGADLTSGAGQKK